MKNPHPWSKFNPRENPRPWDGRTRAVVGKTSIRAREHYSVIGLVLECGHTIINPHGQGDYGDAICGLCPGWDGGAK